MKTRAARLAPFACRARGAELVEYAAILAFVGLLGMVGWRTFGQRVGAKATAQSIELKFIP